MAVLQMQRINICALKKNRKAILERLQQMGAVEIDIQIDEDIGTQTMDVSGQRATFEKRAQEADKALDILQTYNPVKTGLLDSLAGKPLMDGDLLKKAGSEQTELMDLAHELVSLDKKVAEDKAGILKLADSAAAMTPWMDLPVPVDFKGTGKTTALIGTLPGNVTLEDVYKMTDVEAVDAEIIYTDKDYTYVTVICLKTDATKVEEALRSNGFAKPSGAIDKVPSAYCKELEERAEVLSKEITQLETEIEALSDKREDLKLVSDYYRVRAEKYDILGKLPQTQHTFAISGYVPAFRSEEVAKEFSEKYDAVVEIDGIREEEQPPILLKNNKFSASIEGVLASFGLPGKGEMDPSFFTSICYVILFGLMLSDAAYGLIVALACGTLILKFPRMDANLKKSIQLFFWCGLSTLFWGVLFGGYFGNVVQVVAGTFFGVTISDESMALWFVPLNEPMRMLLYSLLFGVIHLFMGLALKGYICLRDRKYLDFFCDCVLWFLLLLGLIGMLLPSSLFAGIAGSQIVLPDIVNTGAKWFAIVGAVGICLMSGRANKNPVVRLALGAYDLYNLTGWLSDVLSYSRLLALGLATGVIASVVNQMGSMGGSGVFGIIVFILVFIIGHSFNLAINLLGAYVHTCRLQYVEFFGKFYEGGGKAFEPFKLKTKYVDFKEEK